MNNYPFLLLFFLMSVIPFSGFCQTINIESFGQDEDMIFGEPVNDMNGNPCAMLIVDVPEVENMKFKGNILGDVVFDDGEYFLYIPQGTKQIKFHHEDFYPGSIPFNYPLQGNTVYRVNLRPDNLSVDEGSTWLVLSVKDQESQPMRNCSVLVDDEEFTTDNNGALELFLENGVHDYVVSSDGFVDYGQSVNLADMPVQCSVVMLKAVNGDLVMLDNVDNAKRAFSDSEAKSMAWFLSDKMIHNLNLTSMQAQDVFEINYDYLRQLKPVGSDSEAEYNIRYRNMSFVLDETQWMQYQSTDYFINPLKADGSKWILVASSYFAENKNYAKMTSLMSHYEGDNAASAHYYQARGLGYRDAVSAHVAASEQNSSNAKPFSRLLLQTKTTASVSDHLSSATTHQRYDPTLSVHREQQRKMVENRQEVYRQERKIRRQDSGGNIMVWSRPDAVRGHFGGMNNRNIGNNASRNTQYVNGTENSRRKSDVSSDRQIHRKQRNDRVDASVYSSGKRSDRDSRKSEFTNRHDKQEKTDGMRRNSLNASEDHKQSDNTRNSGVNRETRRGYQDNANSSTTESGRNSYRGAYNRSQEGRHTRSTESDRSSDRGSYRHFRESRNNRSTESGKNSERGTYNRSLDSRSSSHGERSFNSRNSGNSVNRGPQGSFRDSGSPRNFMNRRR